MDGGASPGDWDTGYTQDSSLGTSRVILGPPFPARRCAWRSQPARPKRATISFCHTVSGPFPQP